MNGLTDWQAQQRANLLETIRRLSIPGEVTSAMAAIPRQLFVPGALQDRAYEDSALPIGADQTISQPSLVAMMIAEMRIQSGDRVLEVGTGSGYQAAILSRLAAEVVTVERIPSLAEGAEQVLEQLGVRNVEIHVAGEQLGWPARAPYDSIVVAAAAPSVPEGLVNQLKVDGRMIIPVGTRSGQTIVVVIRTDDGYETRELMMVRFVPLIADEAFPS